MSARPRRQMLVEMDARCVVAEYFDAWNARDKARLRALLDASVIWEGPTWRATGAAECMAMFDQASGAVSTVHIRRTWVDKDEVITWIEVHRPDSTMIPVANWMHLSQGRIDHIRATTDLLPPA